MLTETWFFQKCVILWGSSEYKESNIVILGFYVFNNGLEGYQKIQTLRYSLPEQHF